MNNLRETLKGGDGDATRKAYDKLMQDAQTIGKIIYEQTAKTQPAGAAGPGGSAPGGAQAKADDENDIDAEYEVKNAR